MLIVIRLRKRWMTLETGKHGDPHEPEVEHEDEKDKPTKFKLGFDISVPT